MYIYILIIKDETCMHAWKPCMHAWKLICIYACIYKYVYVYISKFMHELDACMKLKHLALP